MKNRLEYKYGNEENLKKEEDKFNKWTRIKIFGGVVSSIVGIILSNSHFVYYGLIWVGLEFLFEGLFEKIYLNDSESIPFIARIAIPILALLLTIGIVYLIGGNTLMQNVVHNM